MITLQDAEYPNRLRNIFDPPSVLYISGSLPMIDEEPAVAIVGTRDCTPYGVKAAGDAGYLLARSGLIVVTGLARGIDSAAARGALRGGGRVVGVIGSGLDIVYPAENRPLFEDVSCSGAIISEYPPGTAAVSTHFPARNRIISGLSLGVAVIEAPKKSGALITAARALEQGRDVFAMPGNIDAKKSEGSNSLLREGAIPILSGEDIISEYAELFPEKITVDPDSGENMSNTDGAGARGGGDSRGARAGTAPGAATTGIDDARETGIDDAIETKKNDAPDIDNMTAEEYIDLDALLRELSGDERTVAQSLSGSPLMVDDLIVASGLAAQKVLSALTMLEISGLVTRDGTRWALREK